MASKLSGTSKATFSFVKGSLGPLTVVTVLPAVFMAIAGVANVLVTLDPETGQPLTSDQMTLPATVGSLALGLALLFFYCWMVVKVCRLYLDSETPSLIGSGGSLKAGLWITLYYIAAILVILIPMLVASVVVFFGLFGALGDAGNDMMSSFVLPAIAVVLAITLAISWALCRFVVGFVPLAFGESIGLFDGWRISAGHSMGLFGRMMAAVLVWIVLLVLLGTIIGLVLPSGSGATGTGGTALVVQQLLFIVLSIPLYWYTIVLFCEAYHRLTE